MHFNDLERLLLSILGIFIAYNYYRNNPKDRTADVFTDGFEILTKYLPEDYFIDFHFAPRNSEIIKQFHEKFRNCYFSINNETVDGLADMIIPRDRLLIETDGGSLTCTCASVRDIVVKSASYYEMSEEELSKKVMENAETCFQLEAVKLKLGSKVDTKADVKAPKDKLGKKSSSSRRGGPKF